MKLLTNIWVVQGLGLLVLALLLWFAGPLVAIAGAAPLESAMARGLAIGLLFALWLGYRLWARFRAMRKDQQLLGDLAGSGSPEQAASADEVATLSRGFDEALKVLQASRAQAKGGAPCLYELPWYMIIGAPGSGKTTALVNSGLKFPLAGPTGKASVKGVGGTRNCDWWFADEAVLLDTAGRYTTQDSHQAVDAAAWQGFLQLLKKYRPQRPLNGALVALSLSDLLRQTEEERALHAAAVRRRLKELHDVLGVRLPVYVLLTKTDLVAGFNEFFAEFSQEEREQVWGETFAADNPAVPGAWLERFAAGYDELLLRLNNWIFKRIQEEHDIQRRSQVLDFPQQMALLKPALLGFLQAAFAPNRYEAAPLLRGVYFTSGTQEGNPIDRVMGILAGAFRLDRQATPLFSGRGKSFFLTRLLKEVVFHEAELAGADPRIERRQKLIQYGALGVAALLVLGACGLWATSYSLNKTAIAQTEAQIARYRAIPTAAGDALSQFKMLGAKLDVLLGVRDLWANTGLLAHFGLWQGGKLQAGAEDAYGQLAQDYFQPAIVNRLRERMQGSEGGKPEVLYQLLRVYLMFGQPDKLEPKVAMAVIRADWERAFAIEPETLTGLTVHLQNLLAAPLRPTQLDEAFISSMRARLTQVRQDQQCYERFKAEAVLDHSHDFNMGEALKPNGTKAFAFADGREIGAVVVPGLFTAWGYGEFFLKKSLASAKDCLQQNWVLGNPASSADPREIERLHDGLKALYLGEYQQQWSALLAGLKLRPAQNMKQTVDMLDMLSRPDSPVRLLLLAVDKNTALSKVSAAVADLATQAASAANLAPDEQTKKLMGSGAAVAGFGGGGAGDSLRRLESYFDGFNTLVRGEPPPLDATLAKAKELRDYFMQTGGNPAQAAASQIGGGIDVAAQAKMEFARLPEPVKSWLLSLTGAGVSQTLSGAKGALNSKLAAAGIGGGGAGAAKGAGGAGTAGGGSQCKSAFAGRYPFAKGSGQDAPLLDFAKFFAPNGLFDQFFQANLKEFVETGAAQWRPKSADGQSLGLSQAAIGEFQRAAKIRDAFFAAGGQLPQVQFDIKPVDLDAKADSFKLIVEGQEIVYRRGAEQASRLQWPGPVPGSGVRIVFETSDKRQAARGKDGPWALFRLLDESGLRRGAAEQYTATFQAEGFTARYEIRPLSVSNPLSLADLQNFHCPESL